MTEALEARSAETAETREPQLYEWTVLKRRPAPTGKPTYDTVGVIVGEYGSILTSADVTKIGQLAGEGEYLCVIDERCVRLTIVAETVYRKVEP